VAKKASRNLIVLGSMYGMHICLDLSNISKAFYGSMMITVIYNSSSFLVLSMWEWFPCRHHGCIMSRITCEASKQSQSHYDLLLSSTKRDFGITNCKGETSLQ
jgi:hypothetical protein